MPTAHIFRYAGHLFLLAFDQIYIPLIFFFQCLTTKHNTHANFKRIECCNSFDECNLNNVPTISPPSSSTVLTTITESSLPQDLNVPLIAVSLLAIGISAFMVFLAILLCKLWKPDPEKYKLMQIEKEQMSDKGRVKIIFPPTAKSTLAPDDCVLLCPIARNSFSTIWKARTSGSPLNLVAIRYYIDQRFWLNEKAVLEKVRGNLYPVLKYSQQSPPYCSLVTDFYHLGSLHDHLYREKDSTLTLPEVLTLAHSIATGLEYLHKNYTGIPGKPPIAHCNLKPSNILMAADGKRCVISDFSMSMVAADDWGSVADNLKTTDLTVQLKTLRYLAPEVLLAHNFRAKNINDAKAADIYSLSLILWELSSRCDLEFLEPSFEKSSHIMPYQEQFPDEPDNHSLYKLIYEQNTRPNIPSLWDRSPILRGLREIIILSWPNCPQGRLPASIIRVRLCNLRKMLGDSCEHIIGAQNCALVQKTKIPIYA